jgi:hypothetical protein
MSAGPIIAAIQQINKEEYQENEVEEEVSKEEQEYNTQTYFLEEQLNYIDAFFRETRNIQVIRIKILSYHEYIALGKKSKASNFPIKTKSFHCGRYTLKIYLQVLPSEKEKQTEISEKDWQDLLSLLKHYNSIFVSIAEYMDKNSTHQKSDICLPDKK